MPESTSRESEAPRLTGKVGAPDAASGSGGRIAGEPMSERDYTSIIGALPDMVFELSADGVFTRCYSERHEDLLLPPEEFVGKRCEDVLPPAIARITRIKLAKAFETMEVQRYEYRLAIGSGLKYFESRLAPVDSGNALALVRNITDRKTAENELRQYRNYLDKVFDDLPAVLIFKSVPDFKYLMVNSQVEEFLGLPAEEIVGKTDYELLPEHADAIRREDMIYNP